jgi:2-dehydro-3-deoxygluconokinase
MINIVFFGECMIEKNANEGFSFGGDSLNSALYCARAASQERITVSYATAIGQDKESLQLIKQWQQEGIDTHFVSQIEGKKLGRYSISNNAQGERSFSYERDDSAAKYYFSHHNNAFEEALLNRAIDYLYLTGISLAILSDLDCQHLLKLLEEFKRKGGRIIFDNNYRPTLWENRQPQHFYQQAMKLADIAFLTDEDEYALFGGNSIESILSRYPLSLVGKGVELVIKQGDKPCLIRPSEKEVPLIEVSSPVLPKEKIIDTCAAGDAFSAGYLAKRFVGYSIDSSAQFAHALAGRVIQYSGAVIGREYMNDLMHSSDTKVITG